MKTLIATIVLLALTAPASAQLPVTDVLNIYQHTLTAIQTVNEAITIVEQLQHQTKFAANAGDLSRYKTPAIIGVAHDVSAHPYAANTLTGLNSGDARGDLYMKDVRVLDPRVAAAVAALPPDARRQMLVDLSDVDLKDSVAERTIQLSANARAYGSTTGSVLGLLEGSVLAGRSGERYLTAVMEKQAALSLVDGRQRSVSIQILSTVLEQLLAKNRAARDADVVTMNSRINALTADPAVTGWMQRGIDADLVNREALR